MNKIVEFAGGCGAGLPVGWELDWGQMKFIIINWRENICRWVTSCHVEGAVELWLRLWWSNIGY